jgi:L-fuconolactonase
MTPPPIIDGHIHFWDPGERQHAWLSGEPLLARRFVPDHVPVGHHDVVGFVFVQADCRDSEALDEVAWVSRLAEAEPRIQAIVAHAALERGSRVGDHLEMLAGYPRVAGVRRLLQDEPDGLMARPSFVAGVRLLAEFGFSFDVCVRHPQLPAVAGLVAVCPEVTFVLDHLGKPAVAAGVLDPWRADLRALAQLPNVLCKLSGLTTEAAPGSWRAADLEPYLAHAIDVFGPERCLVGSDWPVSTLATTYEQWFDLVLDALSGIGESELRGVLAGNAGAAYGFTSVRQDDREMERPDARSELRR